MRYFSWCDCWEQKAIGNKGSIWHQGPHLSHWVYFRRCHSDTKGVRKGVWCSEVHYILLLCYLWQEKVLFYHFFQNSTVWSLQLNQPWGSTIWSQNTDTILHWCMPLTLLKLQVLLRKESLQCGHISSPRMFKSWDRSSVQTSCAGVFLCVLDLSPSSTYHLKESKHSINNVISMRDKAFTEK